MFESRASLFQDIDRAGCDDGDRDERNDRLDVKSAFAAT